MSSSDNIHGHTPPQTAGEFLLTANATLAERGKQYDAGGKQERSMGKAVAAFNAIHGSSFVHLTEAQGWAFMAILKLVRGAHKPHADSALDLVGYSALYAECVAGELAVANSEKVQVAALMATINEGTKYCPFCDAPHDLTDGSCRACGYEWEDAGSRSKQEAAMSDVTSRKATLVAQPAEAPESYEQLQAKLRKVEANYESECYAHGMAAERSNQLMESVEELQDKLRKMEESLRIVSYAREEEIERNKQLMIRNDELHSDVSQAMKELADIRAECAERRQDAEAQSKAFTESRLSLERVIGAERAQVAKLRAQITKLSN